MLGADDLHVLRLWLRARGGGGGGTHGRRDRGQGQGRVLMVVFVFVFVVDGGGMRVMDGSVGGIRSMVGRRGGVRGGGGFRLEIADAFAVVGVVGIGRLQELELVVAGFTGEDLGFEGNTVLGHETGGLIEDCPGVGVEEMEGKESTRPMEMDTMVQMEIRGY